MASRGILLTDERRLITYHEAGHALVSPACPSDNAARQRHDISAR